MWMPKIYKDKELSTVPNNIYVDTNIIIDICDDTREFHKKSLSLITKLQKEGNEIFINSDTYANLFYIMRSRSKYDLSTTLAKMRLITTIFTLVLIEQSDIEKALQLCEDKELENRDYEDAMQYICAKKCEAIMIVTNDKGFISGDIEVVGSFDEHM